MSSSVDQLPHEPTDPETPRDREESKTDSVEETEGFDAEFAAEIRSLFGSDRGKGLFGNDPTAEAPPAVAETTSDTEPDEKPGNETVEPRLFAASVVAAHRKIDDAKPSVGLFLPRSEEKPERAAPALTGLSLAAGKPAEPVSAPNLFVSSDAAPAEVAFVPAEAIAERRRYRWLLILLGLLVLGGAIWLTIMAQSDDTVDAPVTTIAPVPTTAVTTTEAPATTASTTVSTTGAPATTQTTVASTVATTAAPRAQPTAPRRPVTTVRRPTTPPTTAAPTTAAPIPDLTLPPPTAIPTTTAAPPATPAETAATAPAEPAAGG
jgi:hypothetical protein